MKKISMLTAIIFTSIACTVQNEFRVAKPGEEPEKSLGQLIYVLPQTVIKLKVEFIKETFIPGPYRQFSPSHLGISDVRQDFSESWDLASVKIDYLTEPDPSHYYCVNITKGKPDFSSYLTLTSQGLILTPDKWIQHKTEFPVYPALPQPPYFTDLSVSSFFKEVTDTLYKTIITDTSFVRVPIPRRQRQPKTLEQKAEEAAGFILYLREIRFDLLSGESDTFLSGNTLEFAINELKNLEEQYLELFTGKTISQSFTGTIFLTPGNNDEQYNIIKLLAADGSSELLKYNGEEVILTITPLNKSQSLDQRHTSGETESVNHYIYRIPDMATFKVTRGNTTYYEERATLYQAGKIVYLPVM